MVKNDHFHESGKVVMPCHSNQTFFADLYDLKSISFKFGKDIIIDFEMPRSFYINVLLENQHFVAIPSIYFKGP